MGENPAIAPFIAAPLNYDAYGVFNQVVVVNQVGVLKIIVDINLQDEGDVEKKCFPDLFSNFWRTDEGPILVSVPCQGTLP